MCEDWGSVQDQLLNLARSAQSQEDALHMKLLDLYRLKARSRRMREREREREGETERERERQRKVEAVCAGIRLEFGGQAGLDCKRLVSRLCTCCVDVTGSCCFLCLPVCQVSSRPLRESFEEPTETSTSVCFPDRKVPAVSARG